jgi:hypothetical protein
LHQDDDILTNKGVNKAMPTVQSRAHTCETRALFLKYDDMEEPQVRQIKLRFYYPYKLDDIAMHQAW